MLRSVWYWVMQAAQSGICVLADSQSQMHLSSAESLSCLASQLLEVPTTEPQAFQQRLGTSSWSSLEAMATLPASMRPARARSCVARMMIDTEGWFESGREDWLYFC